MVSRQCQPYIGELYPDRYSLVQLGYTTQGSKASEKLLESFAEKLRESLTSGNLYIGNWEPDKGTNINVTNVFSTLQAEWSEIKE